MPSQDFPQIYLITPAQFDTDTFPELLVSVLDAGEIACLRLSTAGMDEETVHRSADIIRKITFDRDIPLVIEEHGKLVLPLGLDGVHLNDAGRSVRSMRKELGSDAIIGAGCGASRHDGMTAAEAGADYISFSPVGKSTLGDGVLAEKALFTWWSEMIEVPVVAEGNLDQDLIKELAGSTDFFALGNEIWSESDPAARFGELLKPLTH